MILDKTKKATANSKPLIKKNGVNNKILINLVTSSVIFDKTWGIIFCLPKKYPLRIPDIEMKGKTNPIANNE